MTITSKDLFNSVIFQILLAMLLIAGLALASMSLSVYVTLSTQNDAEAINMAGSLRMQSYRISHILAQADESDFDDALQMLEQETDIFSAKLFESTISESVLNSGNTPLEKSYRQVVSNWQNGMLPLLSQAGGEVSWTELNREYTQRLGEYVQDIDEMVSHLQRNTEGKIELLGMTEGVSIILVIAMAIFFVMKADSNIIVPLQALVRAAVRVEKGDLTQRINYEGSNELGALSQTFNNMTESLEAQYRTLEDQVAQRTDQLRRSNQALYFLYKTSREIASSPYDQQVLAMFLDELKKVADVELINLCVNAEPNYVDYELVSTGGTGSDNCIGDCNQCGLIPGTLDGVRSPNMSLPIRSRDDLYGFLYVRIGAGKSLDPWQKQLLNTVAETLSTAFAFHHTLGQEQRVILLEERSTIARELHDSLAQSLSYMKMETARLRKMIERGFEPESIDGAISDLQEGLNAAYKHLRELLVTFRVKMDAPNLRTALEHAVQEFDELTSAEVSLAYTLGGYALGPNEDIHVLHILREALNNAVKHAKASNITLQCTRNDQGELVFSVEDDGIGLPEDPEKEHHYGMYTMRERSLRLNGILTCSQRNSGGTRVELRVPGVTALMHA